VKAFEGKDAEASMAAPKTATRALRDTNRETMFIPPTARQRLHMREQHE
jgi:hypothetical protein